MFRKSLLAIVFTLVASAALHAVIMTHPAGFKLSYPDEWKQKINGNDLKVLSPDGKAIMLFRVIEVTSVPEAIQSLEPELKKVIADPKIEHKPKPVTINSLPGLLADGSGMVQNIKVKWIVGMFIRENKGLMVLGCANADAFAENKDTLVQIINSISGQ